MSSVIDTLVEMGFPKERAELAVSKTDNTTDVQVAMDWLLSHEEDDVIVEQTQKTNKSEETVTKSPECMDMEQVSSPKDDSGTNESTETQIAKSIKCDDCGKLFKTQDEVEFHAAKTGHGNFSESTEEKKPLTEEEKKEQLAKIEAKLRQRRLDREERERLEALEKEKKRIKSGKDLSEARRKMDEIEMKKIIDEKRREKEEERLARQRVKDQIEQDKIARKAKFGGGSTDEVITSPITPNKTLSNSPSTTLSPKTSNNPQTTPSYSEVRLQIRLTNGSNLTQTFGAKEPLSAVRLYIEMNRTDPPGPFKLMMFPRHVFQDEDYEKPLEALGLAPSAVIIVQKIVPLLT